MAGETHVTFNLENAGGVGCVTEAETLGTELRRGAMRPESGDGKRKARTDDHPMAISSSASHGVGTCTLWDLEDQAENVQYSTRAFGPSRVV